MFGSPSRLPVHVGAEPRRLCRPPLPRSFDHVAQRDLVHQSLLLRALPTSATRREV